MFELTKVCPKCKKNTLCKIYSTCSNCGHIEEIYCSAGRGGIKPIDISENFPPMSWAYRMGHAEF